MKKDATQFRGIVRVQEKVEMSLHRLSSGDGLHNIGYLYEIHKNTSSKIVMKFYRAVRKHLQHVFV